jgi:hypothetical protein
LNSSEKLKSRLKYINELQDLNELQIHCEDRFLNYKLEEKFKPVLGTLTDLKHSLIGSTIRENMIYTSKFEWFVKREGNHPEYFILNRFNDTFGMKYEPLTNHSEGKTIIFKNNPSIMFYEILTQPRELIEADMEGVRYAGRARFEFDLNKNHEGILMFYSDPIKLPREIKEIEDIPVGQFYVKSWLGEKYRLAVCVENENYVVQKDGSKTTSSNRFELEKMGDYDHRLRESLWKNPVVSKFRLMKFYFADEGKDKIQETRNFTWNSVHLEKEKYHTIPKNELNLELFIEKAEQLGVTIISEPTPGRFDGAYDMKYRLV